MSSSPSNMSICPLPHFNVVSMLNVQDHQIGFGDNPYFPCDQQLHAACSWPSMEYSPFPLGPLSEDDMGFAFDDLNLGYGSSPAEPSHSTKLMWTLNEKRELSERHTVFESHDQAQEENPSEMDDSLLDMYRRIAVLARMDPNLPSPVEDMVQQVTNPPQQISTTELIKLAGTQYMGSTYNGDHCSLGRENEAGLALIHTLLLCADNVADQRHGNGFDRLLSACRSLASPFGNPAQRVAYYFAEALRERAESAKSNPNPNPNPDRRLQAAELPAKLAEVEMAFLALYQTLPFGKALHFTANQAILEAVGKARRIHVIDMDIRLGFQWPGFMQSLAGTGSGRDPPRALKLTAVGSDREKLQRTGRRLAELAESLNLAFTFQTVVIKKMEELHHGLFDIQPGEAVAINASITLQGFLWKEGSLEWLVRVVKRSNPVVFTVIETEAQHNSPSFANRFVEALFYYGAVFDSLEASLDRNSRDRFLIERVYLATGIRSLVACEGKQRVIRHVAAQVWRSFLRLAGFSDVAFSRQAKYQAKVLMSILHRNYKPCSVASPFTLVEDGCTLSVGWKQTPVYSVSAWTPNPLLHNK